MTIVIKFGNHCVPKFVLTLNETYCIKRKSIKIVAIEHRGIEVDAFRKNEIGLEVAQGFL